MEINSFSALIKSLKKLESTLVRHQQLTKTKFNYLERQTKKHDYVLFQNGATKKYQQSNAWPYKLNENGNTDEEKANTHLHASINKSADH